MLYLPPGSAKLIRAQGALITDHEIEQAVQFIAKQGRPSYEAEIHQQLQKPVSNFDPMHVFGLFGLASLAIGLIICLYLTFLKIAFAAIINRPLLILGVVLVLGGIQLFSFGLLAELLMRTYHESRGRPIYRVREVVESDPSDPEV